MAGHSLHARMPPKERNQLGLAHASVKILAVETSVILEEAVRQDIFDGGPGILEEVIMQQYKSYFGSVFGWCRRRSVCRVVLQRIAGHVGMSLQVGFAIEQRMRVCPSAAGLWIAGQIMRRIEQG